MNTVAYYHDNQPGDERLPHKSRPVSVEELASLGIKVIPIPAKDFEGPVRTLAFERGYPLGQEFELYDVSLEGHNGDKERYEARKKNWATELTHPEECMWYALQSGGYYDFRDAQDAWIRIPFVAENLYICPAGSFHRYITIDDNNVRAKILRLVKGDPGWRYIEREEAEQLPLRAEYLKSIGVGA